MPQEVGEVAVEVFIFYLSTLVDTKNACNIFFLIRTYQIIYLWKEKGVNK
jgi:hypothetical protein